MTPFLSRKLIYPLQESLLKRPTFSYLQALEDSQWLTRAELEDLQLQKLQNLSIDPEAI